MPPYKSACFYCPVCSQNLGNFNKSEIVIAHCDECRTKFVWKPGDKTPKSIMDKDIHEPCGCGRCGR